MNIAILIVSSASLVCSAGCLCILLKGAKEMQGVKSEVATVRTKTNTALRRMRSALDNLEL